jgi:homoserine kinase type II
LSVYTKVGRDELAAWLQPLGLGCLIEHTGISAGMQNSNYFVITDQGRYVLTLFERIAPESLDFYLQLMAHLAGYGIPCPQPLRNASGQSWRMLAGKPAALLTCLPGVTEERPSPDQCFALGAMLAKMHLAGRDLKSPLPNPCGAEWRQSMGEALLPGLSAEEQALLRAELSDQAAEDYADLPRGVIHADLFRDNVLWTEDGDLSGVLDFYFAGEDCLLFDLAVVANDWCVNDATRAHLFAGYRSQRSLEPAEIKAWPAISRAAALRFWLLRLEVRQRPRAGEVVTIKDPDDFARLLAQMRLAPEAVPR